MTVQTTLVIAIDGATATGKSTLSRELARRYGLACFNTGAVYRAITLACLERSVPVDDAGAVSRVASHLHFDARLDPDDERFFIDGVDRSIEIRQVRVTAHVAQASAHAEVRRMATSLIRRLVSREVIAGRGVVLEGRDVTTRVFPDAGLRLLLVAEASLRQARRESIDATSLVSERDLADSQVADFLRPAQGVEVIDTGALDWGEVVSLAIALVDRTLASSRRDEPLGRVPPNA